MTKGRISAELKTAALIITALLAAGCGQQSQSVPARTAREQLLISTAADRALSRMDYRPLRGKRVFVEPGPLESYEHQYVLSKFKNAVAFYGGLVVQWRAMADVIVELRSGALSMNESSFLFGIPEIPLIIIGSGFVLPEIALFKRVRQTGEAKLEYFAYDAFDSTLIASSGTRLGSSKATSYTILLIGPFTFDNLPGFPLEVKGYSFSMENPPPRQPAVGAPSPERLPHSR